MYNNFTKFFEQSKKNKSLKIAIVNPIDEFSLGGAVESAKQNIIDPILIGSKQKITQCALQYGFDISSYSIIDCSSEIEILDSVVKLAQNNEISAIMKGQIHTDHLMSAMIKKENNLRTGKHISHIFALSLPTYHKLLFITDCAINIYPSLEQKEKILLNSIEFLHKTGINNPKIAILSAVESVNPKIISSVEAESLSKNPIFTGKAIIEGPLAFDNAISQQSAKIKGINSKIAGDVDLLMVPNIESGNILFKSLVYLANAQSAGIVLGTKVPIILTSRSDSIESRFLSTILASLWSNN